MSSQEASDLQDTTTKAQPGLMNYKMNTEQWKEKGSKRNIDMTL